MNEIRNDGHNTENTHTETKTVEPGVVVDQQSEGDTALASPVEKKTIGSGLTRKSSAELLNTDRELMAAENKGIVQGIGHQLKAARMARNMSIEDVSRQLRISVQQIEAIEREDFDKLPGRTFLRGFIRNYTNLMHLDPAPILKLLPQSQLSGVVSDSKYQTPEISFLSRKAWSGNDYKPSKGRDYRQSRGSGFLFKTFLLMLLLFISYGIYHGIDWKQVSILNNNVNPTIPLDIGTDSEQGVVELQLPLPPVIPLDSQQTDQSANSIGTTPFESNSSSIAGDSLSSSVSRENSPSDDSGVLHFKFIDESWVKVQDSTDAIIFEQMNDSGSEQIIGGKRPLSLVIGNAPDVNLTYNGRSIDLAPYTDKNKNVARFTLE